MQATTVPIRSSILNERLTYVEGMATDAHALSTASTLSNALLLNLCTSANNAASHALINSIHASNLAVQADNAANAVRIITKDALQTAQTASNLAFTTFEVATKASSIAFISAGMSAAANRMAFDASNLAVDTLHALQGVSATATDGISALKDSHTTLCNLHYNLAQFVADTMPSVSNATSYLSASYVSVLTKIAELSNLQQELQNSQHTDIIDQMGLAPQTNRLTVVYSNLRFDHDTMQMDVDDIDWRLLTLSNFNLALEGQIGSLVSDFQSLGTRFSSTELAATTASVLSTGARQDASDAITIATRTSNSVYAAFQPKPGGVANIFRLCIG